MKQELFTSEQIKKGSHELLDWLEGQDWNPIFAMVVLKNVLAAFEKKFTIYDVQEVKPEQG